MTRPALLVLALTACASHQGQSEAEAPVVHPSIGFVDQEAWSMAVPVSWAVRDGTRGEGSVVRVGDAIGLPPVDENGALLEIGLVVDRGAGGDLAEAVELHRKALLREHGDATTVEEEVALCKGRRGVVVQAIFAEGERHTLRQTLLALDGQGHPWQAALSIRTGATSRLSTKDGELAPTLRPWLLTFCGEAGTHHTAPLRPLLGEAIHG